MEQAQWAKARDQEWAEAAAVAAGAVDPVPAQEEIVFAPAVGQKFPISQGFLVLL